METEKNKQQINLVQILKHCPKGLELDSSVYNDVTFLRVDEEQNRVYCKAGPADTFWVNCRGAINHSPFGKCTLFPKGKTNWDDFKCPPITIRINISYE